MLYFLTNMLSKTRPSRVQALSKRVQTPHFYVQAWEIRFQKYCKKQHGLVQAFRPAGLFIILKGRTTPMPVLRGLRLLDDAQISPLLEFYLHLLRFWFLTHSKIQATTLPPLFQRGESSSWIWKSHPCVYSELPVLAHDLIHHRFHHHHRDLRLLLRLLSTACCDSSAYA